MIREEVDEIVRGYIRAYNTFDVEGMIGLYLNSMRGIYH